MEQNIEIGLLNWVANEVCEELFSIVSADPKLMVNNWCAFAVVAIFREASTILDTIKIPTIDECMAGLYEPPALAENPKWEQMKEWHSEHWSLSQIDDIEGEYSAYIAMTELRLQHFTLSL